MALSVGLLVLSACAYRGPKTDPGGGTTLTNTYWKLVAVDEAPYAPVSTKHDTHIILRPDHRVTGFGGCNNFSGSWLVENGQLVLGPLLSARMACPDMDSERILLVALDGAVAFELEGETLLITGTDGTDFKFQAVYMH